MNLAQLVGFEAHNLTQGHQSLHECALAFHRVCPSNSWRWDTSRCTTPVEKPELALGSNKLAGALGCYENIANKERAAEEATVSLKNAPLRKSPFPYHGIPRVRGVCTLEVGRSVCNCVSSVVLTKQGQIKYLETTEAGSRLWMTGRSRRKIERSRRKWGCETH
jgi:hypothetical protein